MDKRREFNEALADLMELAATNGNKLATEEIDSMFEGIIDDKSMLEHVYEYLVENKVTITGYVKSLSSDDLADAASEIIPSDDKKDYTESATEQAYIDMYLSELEDIMPATKEEEEALIAESLNGSTKAKDRLVELNLSYVIEIVENFRGEGVHTSDLIQEGNLGLIQGIATYDGKPELDYFKMHLKDNILTALNNALDEEIGASRIGRHIADRANALDRFCVEFAKEHEREATLAEISEGMALPEEEIRNIMKHSLDALNSDGEE